MARKESGRSAFDEGTAQSSLEAYGLTQNVSGPNPNRVKMIALDTITPDPAQPRSAIPRAAQIEAGPGSTTINALWAWHRLAYPSDVIGAPDTFMRGAWSLDKLAADAAAPLQARLVDLYGLALSIKSDDLTNPITVAQTDSGYMVETGERRYLAYTLLHSALGNDYARIPARVMGEYSVWRQAHENTNRLDLTAIEKAKQLARLLIAMWQDDKPDLMTYAEAVGMDGNDLAYYAQANDLGSRRGMGDKLLDAMGVSNRGSITKYKKLLQLTPDEWVAAERDGTSLNELLGLIDTRSGTSYQEQSKSDPESYVANWQHNTDSPTRPTLPQGLRNDIGYGDRVTVKAHGPGTVRKILNMDTARVELDAGGTRQVHWTDMARINNASAMTLGEADAHIYAAHDDEPFATTTDNKIPFATEQRAPSPDGSYTTVPNRTPQQVRDRDARTAEIMRKHSTIVSTPPAAATMDALPDSARQDLEAVYIIAKNAGLGVSQKLLLDLLDNIATTDDNTLPAALGHPTVGDLKVEKRAALDAYDHLVARLRKLFAANLDALITHYAALTEDNA